MLQLSQVLSARISFEALVAWHKVVTQLQLFLSEANHTVSVPHRTEAMQTHR